MSTKPPTLLLHRLFGAVPIQAILLALFLIPTLGTVGFIEYFSLVLISAGLISGLTSRWFTQPILELNLTSEQLGKGNWYKTFRMHHPSRAELTRSFNHMAAQLRTSLDILEAKNEELRLAEAKYHSIFENALEGIFQSSPEGFLLNVNPACAQLFGYSSPEEMLVEVQDISHQIYVDAHKRDEFKRLLAEQEKIRDFEFEAYQRDRSKIWVSVWARAVKDAQGNFLYYEGNCIDITQHKHEEIALKQQLQELQINIDHHQRTRQVAAISATDYFQQLLAEAEHLRYSDD